MFLILLCATFAVLATGRGRGADAWIRRHVLGGARKARLGHPGAWIT